MDKKNNNEIIMEGYLFNEGSSNLILWGALGAVLLIKVLVDFIKDRKNKHKSGKIETDKNIVKREEIFNDFVKVLPNLAVKLKPLEVTFLSNENNIREKAKDFINNETEKFKFAKCNNESNIDKVKKVINYFNPKITKQYQIGISDMGILYIEEFDKKKKLDNKEAAKNIMNQLNKICNNINGNTLLKKKVINYIKEFNRDIKNEKDKLNESYIPKFKPSIFNEYDYELDIYLFKNEEVQSLRIALSPIIEYIKEELLKSPCKKYINSISTGDGDEGALYIYYNEYLKENYDIILEGYLFK